MRCHGGDQWSHERIGHSVRSRHLSCGANAYVEVSRYLRKHACHHETVGTESKHAEGQYKKATVHGESCFRGFCGLLVRDGHVGPFGSKRLGYCRANSSASACDKRTFPFECHLKILSVFLHRIAIDRLQRSSAPGMKSLLLLHRTCFGCLRVSKQSDKNRAQT